MTGLCVLSKEKRAFHVGFVNLCLDFNQTEIRAENGVTQNRVRTLEEASAPWAHVVSKVI